MTRARRPLLQGILMRGILLQGILWSLLLAAPLARAQSERVQQFTLSSARQLAAGSSTLRAYLDVLGPDQQPLSHLDAGDLSATLGAAPLRVRSLTPFARTGEGVAFIFLVDVSKSLSPEQFGRIREALDAWVSQLGGADRAAILAFGESSRTVVDFTDDHGRLREGLESLGPTDRLTVLHQALSDALALNSRQDPDLPGRRAVILLTDGRDEGSALAMEDVLATLREHPVPIYAIGYSQLPEPDRGNYLRVLNRLASLSGGAFFQAEVTRFDEAYGAIRQAIDRVWTAELECATCQLDGDTYRLQLSLAVGPQTVSDGRDLRLLPAPRFPGRGEEGAAEVPLAQDTGPAPAGAHPSAERPEGAEPAEDGSPRPWYLHYPTWIWAVAMAALLALFLLIFVGRRGGRAEPAAAEPAGPAAPEPSDLPPLTRPPRPLRAMPVRLVVVRGSRKGREYRLVLRDRAVVGGRSSCDCVLTDEPNIAPTQFELLQEDGQVLVGNLADQRPTKLGGLPLKEPRRVKSGSLVGNDDTILRIVFDT